MDLITPLQEEADRFFAKVEKDTTSGCWMWTASRNNGYGRFKYRGEVRPAHRVAYWWFVGWYDAEHLEPDHLCRNRACVNPEHLELVPHRDNVLRGESPTAVNAHKTHCLRGHPLTGDNLYITTTGGRCCMACARFLKSRWRAENFEIWIRSVREYDNRPEVKERRAKRCKRRRETEGELVRAYHRDYMRKYRLRKRKTESHD